MWSPFKLPLTKAYFVKTTVFFFILSNQSQSKFIESNLVKIADKFAVWQPWFQEKRGRETPKTKKAYQKISHIITN